jgi:hypothetical protein
MASANEQLTETVVSAKEFRELIDHAGWVWDSLVSCQENEVLHESARVGRVFALLRAARLKRANPELERQRVNMFGTMLRTAQFRLRRLAPPGGSRHLFRVSWSLTSTRRCRGAG